MVVHACNPSSGGWGRRIAQTQEAEVAVSLDRTTELQPEQQSKLLSQNKKKLENLWFLKITFLIEHFKHLVGEVSNI